MTPAPTSPQCAPHQHAAVATCVRCGSFLCAECTELLGEAAYCAACVDFLRAHGSSSWSLKLALVLGALSAPTLPLALALAWWLEGQGIRTGEVLKVTYAIALGWGLPVLHALALTVGLVLTTRELRRPLLSSWARRLARWTRALALLNLGYFLLELGPLVWSRLVHLR